MSSKLYQLAVRTAEKYVPKRYEALWHHPAGPKTIHFWAPLGKWALVIAGLGDLTRPAERLSVNQSAALAATGAIWARYSVVIIPKNYSLMLVNALVAMTGFVQLGKIAQYRYARKEE